MNVDHKVIFGSVTKPEGTQVRFTDYATAGEERRGFQTEVPEALRPLLATKVTGAIFARKKMPNGDFRLPVTALATPRDATRVLPPGAR